ncbi:hypothetical protein FB645_004420 [Coemansia sp. IMI 203386]|nr:hypothetical protein FB645_004420 [Coemansia sp. IMI 203386]
MNDSITFFIALGVVFIVLRWLLGQGGDAQGNRGAARTPRRTHVVRQEHVQTIQAMFPDIPEAAIRADLARTGSPAITSDNILRNGGFLPIPVATSAEQRAVASGGNSGTNNNNNNNNNNNVRAQTAASADSVGSSSSGVVLNALQSPLVSRLRVSKDADADAEQLPPAPPKVWESDSDKRSDVLRKRKEFMLMEARKKYMEKQKQKSGSESTTAPS